VDDKQPIVIILGMHRSGTSLIANFIHAIGIEMGQDLPQADEWNAAGYWESQTIRNIHDKILAELNCDWHNPPLYFPADWWRKSSIQELKSALVEFVGSKCKEKNQIYGFKDPRTAILLPVWREIFDELHLEPLYILSVRHPGSVVASLARRDRLSLAHSQALWLKTNLDALSYAGNNLRVVVDYDLWFESGLDQARTVTRSLNLPLPISEELIANAVHQTVHSGLRHYSSPQDETFFPVVTRFYALLRQAAMNGKISGETWTLMESFEKTKDLLRIWDELVAERDAIINAQRKRLKNQKRLFTYIMIAVFVIFSLVLAFVLSGIHN